MPGGMVGSTGVSDMAKKKVRPRPGALIEFLKKREMTRMEAAQVTGIDRKTLAKINNGEEIKLETLQTLATKLHVPPSYFLVTAPAGSEVNHSCDPMHSVMLRKLDGERLAALIKEARRIRWLLNVQVVDEPARKLLEKLERTVGDTQPLPTVKLGVSESLGTQLFRLRAFDSVAGILDEIRKHSLSVLGADYIFWSRDESNPFRKGELPEVRYTSGRHVLLSVETSGIRSRRVQIDPGSEPPKSAQNISAIVFVDGRRLDTGELDLHKVRKFLS
jgi:transcriptional regulator with XRE-family HTH domain